MNLSRTIKAMKNAGLTPQPGTQSVLFPGETLMRPINYRPSVTPFTPPPPNNGFRTAGPSGKHSRKSRKSRKNRKSRKARKSRRNRR